jgi:hypothetical protein
MQCFHKHARCSVDDFVAAEKSVPRYFAAALFAFILGND